MQKVTHGDTKWKKGQISENSAALYAEYMDRLDALIDGKVGACCNHAVVLRRNRFGRLEVSA